MTDKIETFFEKNIKDSDEISSQVIELSTAVLLIEMIHMDDDVTDSERQAVFDTLKTQFSLDVKQTGELVTLAELELNFSRNSGRFVALINEYFSYQNKLKMIVMLWRIAYADKQLHRDEAYFVQHISNSLEVSQDDFDVCRNQVRDEVL